MGRKYVFVCLAYEDQVIENVKAFVDTGSDLTIITLELARELGVQDTGIERAWTASDGNCVYSPIAEIDLGLMEDCAFLKLDEVLIEDAPMDPDSGERVIIGLDFLQAKKMVLDFGD